MKLVITNMVLIITLSDLIAIYADHNSIERGSDSFTCHKNNVTEILPHKNVTKLSQNSIFVQST